MHDDQAIGRVNRMGQTRPCTVVRLLTRDTIEMQMYRQRAGQVGLALARDGRDNVLGRDLRNLLR